MPAVVTAPPPAKVVPKGILGVSFWVQVLVLKFAQYQPTYRLLSFLRDHDLDVSQATVTDGLRHIQSLLQPIYDGLARRNREEDHWHADETSWLVFIKLKGKEGAWNLWVFRGHQSVVFILDPSRAHHVPENHFANVTHGIMNVDRSVTYTAMKQVKDGRIVLALCWAHQRRDFLPLLIAWKDVEAVTRWSLSWLERISNLYDANDARVAALSNPEAFAVADRIVRDQVTAMAQQWHDELQQPNQHSACKKILKSMRRHWPGLTVFVKHPEVPMDNNAGERSERGPVLGRKNFYGSGSLWSGQLAATMFSIFQTLQLWGLSSHHWLTAYLQACAEAGGTKPPNAEAFLPWNLSDEQRQTWSIRKTPKRQPKTSDTS